MVKIKQLCLSIGSAKYRGGGGGGGMVPKVALSYHWITLVKTLILDYTLILLSQYINNGWDHHRQQYILHICGACCGSDAENCSVVTYPTPPTENLRRSARVLSTFRRVWTALPNWSQACSIRFKSGEQAGQSTSWFVPAAGTRPRSWLDGVGRCHPGTMPLAPCSGRKEQPLVAISRRDSDGNLSCRQRSPDLAMCCYSAPNHDFATKMCTKIVSDGDHRSRETATFGKRPPLYLSYSGNVDNLA